jgi:hypothetical protein
MPPEKQRDYEVGYRKPPDQTRFAKGRSGNPRGRSPGAKNLKTLLSEALNVCVFVSDNGGRRKITKREAIITQLVNKSASADLKATQIVLAMLRDVESLTDGSAEPAAFTEADDARQRLIDEIDRLRARKEQKGE